MTEVGRLQSENDRLRAEIKALKESLRTAYERIEELQDEGIFPEYEE